MKSVLTPPREPLAAGLFSVLKAAARLLPSSLRSLDADTIRRSAQRRAGLSDYGESYVHEALKQLVASARDEGRLTALGSLILRQMLVTHLVNRLRIVDAIKREPGILDLPVEAPLFITGLPRTGSSLLQALLALSPEVQHLRLRDRDDPTGRYRGRRGERHARQQHYRAACVYRVAPALAAIHRIDGERPIECVPLLLNAAPGEALNAVGDFPSFRAWCRDASNDFQGMVYGDFRRQLQLLQHWRGDGRRWLLKSPVHVLAFDAIRTNFPDAVFVHTYRDPCEATASFASLLHHLQCHFSDHVDPSEIGVRTLARISEMAACCCEGSIAGGNWIDVDYRELLRDARETAGAVARQLGLALERSAAEAWMAANAAGRHGTHRYTLEAFGSDESAICAATAAYRREFGIAE